MIHLTSAALKMSVCCGGARRSHDLFLMWHAERCPLNLDAHTHSSVSDIRQQHARTAQSNWRLIVYLIARQRGCLPFPYSISLVPCTNPVWVVKYCTAHVQSDPCGCTVCVMSDLCGYVCDMSERKDVSGMVYLSRFGSQIILICFGVWRG